MTALAPHSMNRGHALLDDLSFVIKVTTEMQRPQADDLINPLFQKKKKDFILSDPMALFPFSLVINLCIKAKGKTLELCIVGKRCY